MGDSQQNFKSATWEIVDGKKLVLNFSSSVTGGGEKAYYSSESSSLAISIQFQKSDYQFSAQSNEY